jgi:hypothetical protein
MRQAVDLAVQASKSARQDAKRMAPKNKALSALSVENAIAA